MLIFRKLIISLCKKINTDELIELINEISLILKDKYSDVKLRDNLKEKHPNDKNFKVEHPTPLQLSNSPNQHLLSITKNFQIGF